MKSNTKQIKTWKNLESAFAGESMAYQKYLYFAELARKKGNIEVAELFENTAKHETSHARGHLKFLYPEKELSVADLLEIAIEGETHEYTEMYPGYEKTAIEEGHEYAQREFSEQIEESKEHAAGFSSKLSKISKVFAGLAKVEKKHSKEYENALSVLGRGE
jgi:rubrerythrin